MSRMKPIEINHADSRTKSLLSEVQRTLGMTPNLVKTMASSPAVLEAYLQFLRSLKRGKLGSKLREQIALTVAHINACHYCLSAHAAMAELHGLDQGELMANMRGSSSDPKTAAVLRFARKMVELNGCVTDEQVESVRNAGYDDCEIAEIVAAVALNIFTNYFNHVAQAESDFPAIEVAVEELAAANAY